MPQNRFFPTPFPCPWKKKYPHLARAAARNALCMLDYGDARIGTVAAAALFPIDVRPHDALLLRVLCMLLSQLCSERRDFGLKTAHLGLMFLCHLPNACLQLSYVLKDL